MNIKKLSQRKNLIENIDDAIEHIVGKCHGDVLARLIPVEYSNLVKRYLELQRIKKEKLTPKDTQGQGILFKENLYKNPNSPQI